MSNVPITVAHGDGIGPEIMDATLHILKEAGARIDIETIEIGEKVYLAGNTAASHPSRGTRFVDESLPEGSDHDAAGRRILIAQRRGAKDARPVRQHPSVRFLSSIRRYEASVMDVVIVRENEEDTYAGIEYRQTDQVEECLETHLASGSEKIVRYASSTRRNSIVRKSRASSKTTS
jgi:isocitrate dehydrogenase